MLNWCTLLFGLVFGTIDAITLPVIKGVSTGWAFKWMVIPFILYASTPFIFLQGLAGESLVILNLVWDLFSDVVVTIIGLGFFEETIPTTKLVGVGLSFVSLFLMTYEGDGWSAMLDRNIAALRQAAGGLFSSRNLR
jgi:hypothetical protein